MRERESHRHASLSLEISPQIRGTRERARPSKWCAPETLSRPGTRGDGQAASRSDQECEVGGKTSSHRAFVPPPQKKKEEEQNFNLGTVLGGGPLP